MIKTSLRGVLLVIKKKRLFLAELELRQCPLSFISFASTLCQRLADADVDDNVVKDAVFRREKVWKCRCVFFCEWLSSATVSEDLHLSSEDDDVLARALDIPSRSLLPPRP